MRILISGGGTGGHIYPALALARYALAVDSGAEVLFVGTENGLESKIVPGAGFSLETIPASGYSRRLQGLFPALKDLSGGIKRSRRLIKEFKPDVVLGTGGYVAAPVVAAALLARCPSAIHEQNAIPGLANRWLAPLVKRVCISFEDSADRFPRFSRIVYTGNPRASEVTAVSRHEGARLLGLNPDLKTIVVYGGSRGAQELNRVVVQYLEAGWLPGNTQLLYVTGEIYYREVSGSLKGMPENVRLYPYLDEMPAALAAADMVITRSGATTLAEITALGLPAILVPSPNVVNDHQYYNASLVARAGAALLIRESEFNHYRLRREIERLLSQPDQLERMARSSRRLGVTDAAERLYRCLAAIARPGRKANTPVLPGA